MECLSQYFTILFLIMHNYFLRFQLRKEYQCVIIFLFWSVRLVVVKMQMMNTGLSILSFGIPLIEVEISKHVCAMDFSRLSSYFSHFSHLFLPFVGIRLGGGW